MEQLILKYKALYLTASDTIEKQREFCRSFKNTPGYANLREYQVACLDLRALFEQRECYAQILRDLDVTLRL